MAHFVINGTDYEVPAIDTLTMGEAVTIYDYTGLGLDQLEGSNHPGVASAFLHIAYKRGNPGADDAAIKDLVSNTVMVEAFDKMTGGDDADPLELKTPKSSPRNSGGKQKSSGGSSTTSSDEPAPTPEPTGISG